MEADVVVGFSMGASVALEMVTSGGFAGPAVLLGISLSAKDEPAFFRAIVRLGRLPVTALAKGAASMVKRIPVSAERQAEMREDLRRNDPQHLRHALDEYLANAHLGDGSGQRVLPPERGTRTDRGHDPGGRP